MIVKNEKIGLGVVICTFVAAAAFADAPSVDWASSPVKPGDHVLLQGGNWDSNVVVEIGGRRVKPDWVTDTGLVFAYPSSGDEILTGRVVGKGGASDEFTLNAPTVWWMQGDDSDRSTPGGWLRVFGSALRDGKVKVKGEGEQWKEFPLSRVDDYELAAKVPADLAYGEYEVFVKSAISEWTKAGAWTVAAPRQIWKTDVFNVEDFRDAVKGVVTDSDVFRAALAAAKSNGGGIVRFPRGTFRLKGAFEIPPRTLVRGESRAMTLLDWGDMKEPELYLLIGEHSFGLEELTVHTGYSRGFITHRRALEKEAFGREKMLVPKSHDIVLRNLTLRFVTDEHRDNMSEDNFLARYRWYTRYPYGQCGEALHFPAVERFRMDGVDIYQDKDPMHAVFFRLYGRHLHVSRCHFHGGGYVGFGGREFIFEDTECRCNTYSMGGVTYNAYFARNRGFDNFRNDGEALTHDGQCGVFTAKGVADGTTVTFRHDKPKTGANPFSDVVRKLSGLYSLEIVKGRGRGQIRRVLEMPDWNHVTIDRPFGVTPDETSVFNFAFVRRQVLMLDNFFEDATVGLQLWGGSSDYILARNRFVRGGGIRAIGYTEALGCYRAQFLDNVIEENLGRRPVAFSVEGQGQGMVFRRNEVWSNGGFSCGGKNYGAGDILIEHNVVRNTDYGIEAKGAYIGENVFENVDFPMRKALGCELAPAAREAHEKSERAFVARLKARSDRPYTEAEFTRLFDARLKIDGASQENRLALEGQRGRKPYKLRVALSLGAGLPPLAHCTASAPSVGGWSFGGKPVVFEKDPYSSTWAAWFTVTPSGEMTESFTVPVTVELVGRDGWRARLTKNCAILTEEYGTLLRGTWRYAVVDGWKVSDIPAKPDWKVAEERDAKDGGIDTRKLDIDEKFRQAQKCANGCSMIYETTFELKRPMRVSLNRCDISAAMLVDGKQVFPDGTWWRDCHVMELSAGKHTLGLFRGCRANMRAWRAKSLRAYMAFPDGVKPGEWSCDRK